MSFFGDVGKGLIGAVAPTLATALGGPLAGMAVGWVAKKVLGQDNATLKDIQEFLVSNQSPDTVLKLKNAEQEFIAEMKRMDIDVFALEVQDRVSARDFGTKSVIGQYMQAFIGSAVLGCFFYTVYRVLSGTINLTDPNQAIMVGTIVGYVSAKADQVIAFLFGSSQGSKDKTEQMSNALAGAFTRK